MKRLSILLFIFLFGCATPAIQPPSPLVWSVYFSPKGGCTEAIVRELDSAKKSILVQAYSFTSDPIAEALIEAHKRGVNVKVIIDKRGRTEKKSQADALSQAGIPTETDRKHPIAHSKVMVIDEEIVITGSFNFTRQAESNLENLLIIRDKVLAGKYIKNFQDHAGHSERYP